MKRITALFLVLTTLVMFSLLTINTSAAPWDGTTIDVSWYNTNDTEFTLTEGAQLAGLAAIVNGTATGITADAFTGKTVILGADIDLGGKDWFPIGTTSGASTKFDGTIDGRGHTISNLTINFSSTEVVGNRVGFVGRLSGAMKDINFVGASVITTMGCYSGIATGIVEGGSISRCTIDLTSSVESYTSANGGFAGRVQAGGVIDSCVNHARIVGYPQAGKTGNILVGGIVGMVEQDGSTVKYCVNYGEVVVLAGSETPSNSAGGGIAAYMNLGNVLNCVNYGNVSTDYLKINASGASGIVGRFHKSPGSVVKNCYNFGEVTGKDGDLTQTGLIIGNPAFIATVENCFSTPHGNLGLNGTTFADGFAMVDSKIIAKTDAGYAEMEAAAQAIINSINEVPLQLTVHYVFADGTKAADDKVADYKEGDEYSVDSPTVTGYSPDKEIVSGKFAKESIEVTVTYTIKSFELTIEYVYEADGSKAAESHVETQTYGTEYSVKSPEIAGFKPNYELVEGKFESNKKITVKYKAVEEETEDGKGAQTQGPAEETTKPEGSGGCKSSLSAGAAFVAITAIFGSAIAIKKRD